MANVIVTSCQTCGDRSGIIMVVYDRIDERRVVPKPLCLKCILKLLGIEGKTKTGT